MKRTEYVTVEGRNYLLLDCHYIDWDGEKFGKASKFLVIPEYSGSAALVDLAAYPLKYHPNRGVEEKLKERGNKFQILQGYHYVAYNGVGLCTLEREPKSYHVGFL